MSRHRALLAAGLAAGSVASGLTAVAPAPPPTVEVLVAASDLDARRPLRDGDLVTAALPPAAVPDGTLRPGEVVAGRLLAGPVRRGEPLTDVRLVGPGLLAALGSAVAAPVRVADAGTAALVRAGDRVDVLAASTALPAGPAVEAPAARVVARGAIVIAVPGSGEPADGALVVLATTPAVAAALAAAAVTSRLSLTLRGGA